MIGVVISHYSNHDGLRKCLNSLQLQLDVPIMTLVVDDHSPMPMLDRTDFTLYSNDINRGQQWCRNLGQRYFTKTYPMPYILFCDHDIVWEPGALKLMLEALMKSSSDVAYAYCDYQRDGALKTHHIAGPFSQKRLRTNNFISTMSLCKAKCLPEPAFIEEEKRLQDWSLWLRLLNTGYEGVYLRNTLFTAHYNWDDVSCGSTEDFYFWKKTIRERYANNKVAV